MLYRSQNLPSAATLPSTVSWELGADSSVHPASSFLEHSVHVDLDGAWSSDSLPSGAYFDCRDWGAHLRFCATSRGMEAFFLHAQERPAKFTLLGSGDFHHLSALWLRRIQSPFTLISFDNHPDWDMRPPLWCCGSWINRALQLPTVRRAVVWGCGNFELNWPNRLFANHEALRTGRLEVWPWRERLSASAQKRWPGMELATWREKFSAFARGLAGEDVYVTVDLDCLREQEATSNWEHGLFSASDVAWALEQIAGCANVVGGDVCGAYSQPRYARLPQRIAGRFDHPHLAAVGASEAAERNQASLTIIWKALTD
jgi:arginase family enzyme